MEENLLSIVLPETVDPNLQLPDPTLLQFYKDLDDRVYWIQGEIDDGLLDLVSKIIQFNKDDYTIPIKDRKPIKIIIVSPGGGLEIAKVLCEIIRLSRTPVYTIAIGITASAASMIYLAGHKRFATNNAYFLFHRGSCGNIGGDYNQINQFMEDYRKQVEELEEFYIAHTKFEIELIKTKMNNGDWYIYKDEALENGIVDEIIDNIEIFF